MTRNFDEQRRYDGHPSSRNQSSDRYGEERSPRRVRPRLNRQTVDRAWESGARRDHADYRTRNHNELSPRDSRQRGQYADHSPAQNGRKPFDNYQDGYQRTAYAPSGYQNPRSPRSYDPNIRNDNDRRINDRRGYSPRSTATHSRGASRDNEQFRDRHHEQSHRYEQRGFDRDDRSSRAVDRGSRSSRGYQQRSPQNPRWQSRSWAQNDDRQLGRQDFSRQERFEGDYERFETPDTPQRPVKRSSQSRPEERTGERHVTRLPDGHVLKGPRPAQRRNANFWMEITQDTEAILPQAETPTPETGVAPAEEKEASVLPRSRKRSEGKAIHRGKAKAKQSTARPRSTGPKPSQRGHKWPTP